MKRIPLLLLLVISTGPSYGDGMRPEDVEKFVSRREGCDHFRGEIPGPTERARMGEVELEIRRHCTGTDKQLARLKKKYATAPQIMATLNEFDPVIEGSK